MIPIAHPAREGPPPPAALLFRPGPGLAPAAHRVARALLEDAARHRGGRVSSAGDGTWRLEAAAPALELARRVLSAVLNGRDAALVIEAMSAPAPALPAGTGPEAVLAATPLDALTERRAILGFGPGGVPHRAGWRVRVLAGAVAAAMGPRWAGEPWQAHGRAAVARRMAGGRPEEEPVHREWPPEVPLEGVPPGVLPVLPARVLAAPPAGRFGVDGPDAAALALLDPAHLPGEALHLTLDAALAALPEALWLALRPGRVVLEGVADGAGLEWGLARGIGRFVGEGADRVLASAGRG